MELKTLKIDFNYKNEVELLDSVMSLYAQAYLREEVSYKERIVLREYIRNGYSPLTKQSIMLNLKITDKHLNVINYKLQKKGFLKPHPHNQRMKTLNNDLLRLKEVFIDNTGRKVMLINFNYV